MRNMIFGMLWAIVNVAVAQNPHVVLEKYLTDDVIGVAYLDLSAVDVPGLLEWAEELGLGTAEERSEVVKMMKKVQQHVDALTSFGADHLYLLFRVSDVGDQGPSWVVPITQKGKPKSDVTGDTWPLWMPKFWEVVDGTLLGGMTSSQLEHLKSAQSKTPRDLSGAWAALGQADCGLIIFGDEDSRRVVREMLPPLPKPFAAIDGPLIADGLQWGGFAIKFPPEPHAKIVVETRDAPTATTVAEAISSGLAFAKKVLPLNQAFTEEDREALVHAFRPQVEGARVRIVPDDLTNDVQLLAKVLSPPIRTVQRSAEGNERLDKFKHIALAFHNYHNRYKAFPTHANFDDSGKPLLSWRVHLLPYLDQEKLYKQFHLEEPWDSEHNLALVAKMPRMYADPDSALRKINSKGKTTFVVPVGDGTVFDGPEGCTFRKITDGTSNTILLVEVVPERAVVWTKPEDWAVDLDDPWEGVRREDRDGFTNAFCDGSSHIMDPTMPAKTLRAYLTRAGREVIEWQ